jgi:hypothetical protein
MNIPPLTLGEVLLLSSVSQQGCFCLAQPFPQNLG